MRKRDLIKRLKMELWVVSRVGIPKDKTLASKDVQKMTVPTYFTVGALRTMLRHLEGKSVKAGECSGD